MYISPSDIADLSKAALILVAAFLASLFLRRYIIKKILKIVSRTKTTLDDYLIPSFTRPFFYGIFLVAVYLSAKLAARLSPYQSQVDEAGMVLAIIWVAYTAIKVIHGLAAWHFSTITPDKMKVKGYANIVRLALHIVVWLIAGSMILHKLGIDITPLVATLGVGGLAVGLALQDTLANFFAGFYIIAEKSTEPGDYVELEGTNIKGYIEEISWRTTKIRTPTNNRAIVPNSRLAQAITTNYSSIDKTVRVPVSIHIAYDNNLESVSRIMNKCLKEFIKEHPHCVKSADPWFGYNEFGDSNVLCSASVAADTFDEYYTVRSDLLRFLKREMERHKITMSYPRRIVHQKGRSGL